MTLMLRSIRGMVAIKEWVRDGLSNQMAASIAWKRPFHPNNGPLSGYSHNCADEPSLMMDLEQRYLDPWHPDLPFESCFFTFAKH